MLALVRRARRRLFQNELLAQAANAASAALFVLILLLILGAEILSWQFVVLIPVLAFAIGLYIAKRRLPDSYRTAQIVDRRLGLADTLSTALYYRESEAKGAPEVVRLQAEAAERMAATADLQRALPYTMPRAVYAMTALFIVAGSLFALRYGFTRQLDLKAPLATILRQSLGIEPKTEQAKAKMPKVPRPEIAPDSELAGAEQQQIQSPDQEGNSEQADESEMPGKVESKKIDGASKKSDDGSAQADSDQQEAGNEDRPGNDGDNASSGQQGKQEGKQGNQKQDQNSSGDNSLMSKVKDAVQNLLSRMKPQQNQQNGQQQGEQSGQQQGKGQQNGKQQSAKNGQQQQQGGQQSEGQDGQAGEQAENSQDQQSKGQGNSDSKQASKQPGSGVGSQDGDKRMKQAEQLAAMGKISEIIGKRSQTLTGETTVEVQQSNNQPLKTQYTNKVAQHTQGGAEINRDEVPVALQSYVESYFEQVRKQPAPAPKK